MTIERTLSSSICSSSIEATYTSSAALKDVRPPTSRPYPCFQLSQMRCLLTTGRMLLNCCHDYLGIRRIVETCHISDRIRSGVSYLTDSTKGHFLARKAPSQNNKHFARTSHSSFDGRDAYLRHGYGNEFDCACIRKERKKTRNLRCWGRSRSPTRSKGVR